MCDLKKYIADHYLDVYLEDAINKVMQSESRVDHVEEFLRDYFSKANSGEHILNADGKYILASPYNRSCVVRFLRQTLDPFKECVEHQMSKSDYCSIIELTWPQWDSRNFVQKSIVRFLDRSQSTFPIDDFVRAFSLSVLYEDFLRESDKILLSNKSYSRNRILYKLKEKKSQMKDLRSLWPDRSVIEEIVTEDCSYEDLNQKLFEVSGRENFIDNLCDSTS